MSIHLSILQHLASTQSLLSEPEAVLCGGGKPEQEAERRGVLSRGNSTGQRRKQQGGETDRGDVTVGTRRSIPSRLLLTCG